MLSCVKYCNGMIMADYLENSYTVTEDNISGLLTKLRLDLVIRSGKLRSGVLLLSDNTLEGRAESRQLEKRGFKILPKSPVIYSPGVSLQAFFSA
ncbi:hypothetical protein PoB_000487600 [Plakobranchus ocellatus]|uniref:Uncharacterized protein n=1 Tax=Plakobranchus ocellatus TaxID=259542 RepID=A0AAV3Y7H9_9GAST|nr:hypothetical protein PoB_000487600 [Plakobranchus ocellatus]